jgi:hypothetical protein
MKKTLIVLYQGTYWKLKDLCKHLNLKYHTVYSRIKKNYPIDLWFLKEVPHNTPTGPAHGKFKHGKSNKKSRTYEIYYGMLQRCNNPNTRSYKNYGARGVRVCDRWVGESGFMNFLLDMGEPPTKAHSIERFDNNKNYCKENCTWIEKKLQAKNRRCNLNITYLGETLNAAEWSKRLGLSKDAVRSRFRSGKSIEECLSPKRKRNQFDKI